MGEVEKAGDATATRGMGVAVNELTAGQRVCLERGYHDDEEFIDPQSGGFTRCRDCGLEVDREESEEW